MNDTNTIDKLGAYLKIKSNKNKIFTAVFEKKNGETRQMNCRTGVVRGVKGTLSRSARNARLEKGLLPVFDLQSKGWRSLNLYTLRELHINKKKYVVA